MQKASPLVTFPGLPLQGNLFLYCAAVTPSPVPKGIPGSYLCVLTSIKALKGLMDSVKVEGRGVVCYQEKGLTVAAQVWWLLQAIGFTDVKVLSGGLLAYRSLDQPLATLEVLPVTMPQSEVVINPALYKLEPEIRKFLQTPVSHQLLDTDGSYLSAVHCPARLFLTESDSIADSDSLHLLLAGLNIRLNTTTIVLGKEAAVVLLALATVSTIAYLSLGVVESRPTGPFLTAPDPGLERKSFRTEYYSISGNTEFFDAQEEESVRKSIRLPQPVLPLSSKAEKPQEQSRSSVKEKRDGDTQHSCGLCVLL